MMWKLLGEKIKIYNKIAWEVLAGKI